MNFFNKKKAVFMIWDKREKKEITKSKTLLHTNILKVEIKLQQKLLSHVLYKPFDIV
jgi:hypothetical protein